MMTTTTSGGLGILGGTFDPIHNGHLQVAIQVRQALNLEAVILLPSARPPHRAAPQTTGYDRLAMVEAAVADLPGLIADGRELGRPGPSYTYDTLVELRAENPETPLFLILGADAFLGLPSWHRWQELSGLAHLVIVNRPAASLSEVAPALATWIARRKAGDTPLTGPAGGLWFLEIPPLDISASALRAQLARGESTDLLPARVLAYIQSHHLYQRSADGSA